jgi:hypothetical protein
VVFKLNFVFSYIARKVYNADNFYIHKVTAGFIQLAKKVITDDQNERWSEIVDEAIDQSGNGFT